MSNVNKKIEMDDEKLILLVQEKDFLFNKLNPLYKNQEKKKAAWRSISVEMGIADVLCFKRWTSLRDRYAREKRLMNVPSGSGSTLRPRWQLMSAMDFLAPHIIPRPMRTSANILDQISPPSPQTYSDSSLPPSEILSCLSEDSNFLDLTSDTNSNKECLNETTQQKKRKKSNNVVDADTLFAEAVAAFKDICEGDKKKEKGEYSETLEGFGKMILSTISSMSATKQTKAIQKVTAVVMELKMEPEE